MRIEASVTDWRAAGRHAKRFSGLVTLGGLIVVVAMSVPACALASLLSSGPARYPLTWAFMVVLVAPVVFVLWRVIQEQYKGTSSLMGSLERQLTDALADAGRAATRRESQARRQELETRLANALEMAEGETEVLDVIERALLVTLPDSPVELLLADNSHAHLSRMVVSSPTDQAPMCGVDSPDNCPAARRAQVQRFDDSEAIDACPKLRGRPQGRCAAVCVPVAIMGRTVGVIHATSEVGETFEEIAVQDLGTLANLAGARIGLLRMVAETQLQASTDSLTGLLNRRSLEHRVSVLRQERTPFTMIMADLDNFKRLNDTFGHETGDRALRLFAQTLTNSFRSHDIVSRHGGEEFAVVIPSCTGQQACAKLQEVRTRLASAVGSAGLPEVTASFGVVEAGEAEELATALRRADAALFQAKADGRDRVVLHDRSGQAVPTDTAVVADAFDGSLVLNGGPHA